jgi:hypothetical protein
VSEIPKPPLPTALRDQQLCMQWRCMALRSNSRQLHDDALVPQTKHTALPRTPTTRRGASELEDGQRGVGIVACACR